MLSKAHPKFNNNTNVQIICCPFETIGHLENKIKMHNSVQFVFLDGRIHCTPHGMVLFRFCVSISDDQGEERIENAIHMLDVPCCIVRLGANT